MSSGEGASRIAVTTSPSSPPNAGADSMRFLRMDSRVVRGDDGLPRVLSSNLRLGRLLGQGGDRGSVVFVATMQCSSEHDPLSPSFDAVPAPASPMTPLHSSDRPSSDQLHTFAFKQYALGSQMTTDEHLFSTSAYELLLLDGAGGKRHVRHLVVPEAVVRDANQRDIGILMPIFSCSLHSALRDRQAICPSASELAGDDERESALRYRRSFAPLSSRAVIAAITFQILLGLRALHSLSFGVQLRREKSDERVKAEAAVASAERKPEFVEGFTHNDLNLRNVLLDRSNGRVAICDFELAHRIPTQSGNFRRIPPVVYIPPFGLCSRASDVWCLGLLVLEMITGIQPLLNENVTENDFAEGPLRLPYHKAWEGVTVIDWEANVFDHVRRLSGSEISLNVSESASSSSGAKANDVADSEDAVLLAFCGRCLSNREGAVLPSCDKLLSDPLFAAVSYDEVVAERLVMEWASRDAIPEG